jgi:putative membrane protein
MQLPTWHIHLDVLAIASVLEGGYLWAVNRLSPDRARVAAANVPVDLDDRQRAEMGTASQPATSGRQIAWFTAGIAIFLVASSWPIHDLAERYLFSVHMFQHMLISLVVPPMLLLGMPPWLLRRVISPAPLQWIVRHLARPFVALVSFNLVIVVTHWPLWVNFTLEHHAFHFLAHVILFGSATLMWWPVVAPLPEMPALSYPGRMLYLFLQSIVPTVPASFLTFGSTPLYSFYAHVPRLWGMSVLTDQRIAGLIMKLGGGAILWGVIAYIFFRWFLVEQTEGWDALEWRDVEREIRSELTKR